MSTNQNYAWKQIPVKDTQLKVGDRVKLNGQWAYKVTGLCTIIEIDDEEPMYCVAEDGSNQYWVNSSSIVIESEPTPPTPKWIPIDRDNLPDEPVLAGNLEKKKIVVNRININHLDGTIQSHNRREYFEVTHYIPITDLLNLPISE